MVEFNLISLRGVERDFSLAMESGNDYCVRVENDVVFVFGLKLPWFLCRGIRVL